MHDFIGKFVIISVLEPEGGLKGGSYDISDGGMDEVIEKYAYVYRYDDALRPVYAKLPGCDPVTTVYDPDGLVAYTVDGNLRAKGNARFTLYDAAARPVVTGICNEPTGVVPRMRAGFDSSDPGLDSTYYVTDVPLTDAVVYTATYYDNYDFRSHRFFNELPAGLRSRATDAKGLVTGSLERVLGSNRFIASMSLYDKEERPTLTMQTTHTPGVMTIVENEYNIDGTVSVMNNKLMHPTGDHTDSHTYAYDAAGRLVKETVSYDGGEAVDVQKLSYNAIGTLSGNDLGVFNEEYTYNVRGAMTKRKSAVFEQTIGFSNHFNRLYNGSIGMIVDKLTGGKSTSSGYSYDNAGRLTSAMIFFDGITHPTGYTYDLNSNITTLNRRGYNPTNVAELIDNLVYQYDGNQVKKITEKAPVVISEKTMNFIDGADLDVEYTYDRNGNMTSDANKGLEMSWDYNNRLYKVEDDEMTMTFNRTGSGQKLGKSVYVGPNLKDYLRPGVSRSNSLGGYPAFPRDSMLVYPTDSIFHIGNTTLTENFGSYEYVNGKFTRLNTSTGYRDSEGTHVYVRDWQGNIRAVVRKGDDGNTVLEQATYYYPYGMPMAESTNPTANRYKYTGKELLTNKGFNCYDYGARFYDPATGIWLSVDVLSHKTPDYSHYVFCNADPINIIDLNGKNGIRVIDNENKTITIKANYYVVTTGLQYRNSFNRITTLRGYNDKDIQKMNNYNEYLNNLGLVIESGEFEGYTISFDLTFEDGGNGAEAEQKASEDTVEGHCIGNTIRRYNDKIYAKFKDTLNSEGEIETVGGATDHKELIVMNVAHDSKMNRLHEIFHTLGLDHPVGGGNQGIMHYPPLQPTNQDALELTLNLFIKPILK